ncbi:MAG: hypothetical protein ACXAB4_04010, partial [Candidatus Hodarchaeales archaeon]
SSLRHPDSPYWTPLWTLKILFLSERSLSLGGLKSCKPVMAEINEFPSSYKSDQYSTASPSQEAVFLGFDDEA